MLTEKDSSSPRRIEMTTAICHSDPPSARQDRRKEESKQTLSKKETLNLETRNPPPAT